VGCKCPAQREKNEAVLLPALRCETDSAEMCVRISHNQLQLGFLPPRIPQLNRGSCSSAFNLRKKRAMIYVNIYTLFVCFRDLNLLRQSTL
jgi:hypothetical protein